MEFFDIQLFGSRGVSSGTSKKKIVYGTEYTTLYHKGRVKYVKYNDSNSAKSPMETKTKGRIYATIDKNNKIRYVTFYDSQGMRKKQIDVEGKAHAINGKKVLPHVHLGYEHSEKGTRELTKTEQNIVNKIIKEWYNYNQER